MNPFLRRCILIVCVLLLVSDHALAETASKTVDVPFVVACPFATVADELSFDALRALWRKGLAETEEIAHLTLRPEAIALFSDAFGPPDPSAIFTAVDPVGKIRGGNRGCALIPAVELTPELKRIRVGASPAPWDAAYDPTADPLNRKAPTDGPFAEKSFDPSLVSRVLITGTTALTRNTSYAMAQHGAAWAGSAVKEIFESADIRHISNESSFWTKCPEPIRSRTMQFCTPYEDWRLFESLGVNLIELTGNHLRDYDWPPLLETFELFEREGIPYYGAGRTIEAAAQPYVLRHNGNDFVFLGCNSAGPEHVFVTGTLPGVHRCDFDQLEADVRRYAEAGKIVIVTLQYGEAYSRKPGDYQKRDFDRISEAGAVVVSGSQSHFAQSYRVSPDRIVHYGLGNLFFDQMDTPIVGTRQELLDRHIFYDGRLLQTEIQTAMLTEFARPIPMTSAERSALLNEILPLTEGLGTREEAR